MKNRLICIILSAIVFITMICVTGCNMNVVDVTYSFDEAIIAMPDGTVVKGTVKSWKDYADSDAIQVKIEDKVYYTFLGNVTLIKNE